ncbi:MAG: hypothetical protein ACXAE3_01295 [Candidatus Kariarchaeaceae archaeon]|jgi:single-stranded DNA-specific DHH superfamily exonuclease
MTNTETQLESFTPRPKAIVFGDEDVDGVCSAAIVGRRYDPNQVEFIFVNARSLGQKLKDRISSLDDPESNLTLDVFIVDVGINKANIKSIEESVSQLVKNNVRVFYFDSHSNKYKGKPLLLYLRRAEAHVFHGKIGSAAASIIQDFLGTEQSKRLRLLGALSDREIRLTRRYRNEKAGLRALQAAVAWGAWQDQQFLDKITRRLIKNPQIDLESDRDIIQYAIKANNHRDNLLRHVFRRGQVLEISQTPRILAVTVLDRNDFGKARGTIAGRLAGEWGAAIILITRAVNDENSYAVTVRNSYAHKLDLEALGQLSRTKNSGGSKGAYRLTIKKDNLMIFLSKVQAWSRNLHPPWLANSVPKQYTGTKKKKSKKKNFNRKKTNGQQTVSKQNLEPKDSDVVDLTDLE